MRVFPRGSGRVQPVESYPDGNASSNTFAWPVTAGVFTDYGALHYKVV